MHAVVRVKRHYIQCGEGNMIKALFRFAHGSKVSHARYRVYVFMFTYTALYLHTVDCISCAMVAWCFPKQRTFLNTTYCLAGLERGSKEGTVRSGNYTKVRPHILIELPPRGSPVVYPECWQIADARQSSLPSEQKHLIEPDHLMCFGNRFFFIGDQILLSIQSCLSICFL